MAAESFNWLAVNFNVSLIHIIKAHQQIDKCRFSTAGRSYNGNPHAGIYFQIKIFNQAVILIITEVYMADGHISFHFVDCSFHVWGFFFFLQKIKNTVRTRQRILHLCNDRTNVIERFHILVRIR